MERRGTLALLGHCEAAGLGSSVVARRTSDCGQPEKRVSEWGGGVPFAGRSPAPGSELLTLRKPSSHRVVLRFLTPSYRTLCTIQSITQANLAKHILGQLKL